MVLALRNGLHFCIANERAVFLDLRRDRYFCLPPDKDRQFRDCVSSGKTTDLSDAPQTLEQILTELPTGAGLRAASVPTPTSQARTDALVSPLDLVLAIQYQRDAVRRLKRFALQTVIKDLTQEKSDALKAIGHASPVPESMAAAFTVASRLLSKHDQCLRCSIAFLRFCLRRHACPDLIIGVRMYPFRAHAWIQSGDRVLNDTVDNVSPYTPILVV